MKQLYAFFFSIIAFIFIIKDPSYAATVGNPLDLDIPRVSAVLRQEAIDEALDEYEQIVKIKAALDLEFVFDKDLHATSEVEKAGITGQWCMVKLGTTIFNRVEPYIKIGTSKLKAEWKQNGTHEIKVDAAYGFAWGGGLKGIIWDYDPWGIRLTGDAQYRITEPDVDEISLAGTDITDIGADFNIKEWQAAIVLSKKFELPLKWQSVYMVPYTGASLSDCTADVKFTNPSARDQAWTLYDADSEKKFGFLIGCDIMPTLTSSFIYNMELRLASEIALTLGGAMKF